MSTFASLFTGGGGADYSARRLGYSHLWGVEYDPKIAGVAELNGFPVMVADVCAVDFSTLTAPCWLHMSPPCTNASQANTNAGEGAMDRAMAEACCRAIEALQPPRISLENVWGYRTFAAFHSILDCLDRNGYAVGYWHLNAADYGIPQTRKRLCLVASKEHQPRRPLPTHEKSPDPFDMFALLPWVGWYAAIEDLIPSLPDSAFAPWQLERLPEDLKTCLIGLNKSEYSPDGITLAAHSDPAFAITQQSTRLRGYIVHPTDMRSMPIRDESDPMFTVVGGNRESRANLFTPRAFVVDCQESGSASGLTIREAGQPMYTLSATMEPRRPARAFIIPGGNGGGARDQSHPMHALVSSVSTVSNTRAYVGRVVKMTPRALARFNGLGDDYLLPPSNTLACTVLGNMHILQGPLMEANP